MYPLNLSSLVAICPTTPGFTTPLYCLKWPDGTQTRFAALSLAYDSLHHTIFLLLVTTLIAVIWDGDKCVGLAPKPKLRHLLTNRSESSSLHAAIKGWKQNHILLRSAHKPSVSRRCCTTLLSYTHSSHLTLHEFFKSVHWCLPNDPSICCNASSKFWTFWEIWRPLGF